MLKKSILTPRAFHILENARYVERIKIKVEIVAAANLVQNVVDSSAESLDFKRG